VSPKFANYPKCTAGTNRSELGVPDGRFEANRPRVALVDLDISPVGPVRDDTSSRVMPSACRRVDQTDLGQYAAAFETEYCSRSGWSRPTSYGSSFIKELIRGDTQ